MLVKHGNITSSVADSVRAFLSSSQTPVRPPPPSLQERVHLATNSVAKQLLQTMLEKETNLCVALDYSSQAEVLHLT